MILVRSCSSYTVLERLKRSNLAEAVKEGADRAAQVARKNPKNHAQNVRDRAIENARVIVRDPARHRARRTARCKLTMSKRSEWTINRTKKMRVKSRLKHRLL